MLDLYVWGQAFDLPSIDIECLAAIHYLHHAASKTAWRLIPSSDVSVSPSGQFPALLHDGTWISGYRQIVDHLTAKSLCRDLDEHLDAAQRADVVASSAYLLSHAAPLVDLSLFVSAANWAATTRPAYTALLPFPLTWTVPPLLRAQAIERSEHLGLAALDSDFDPSSALHLTGQSLPESFRRHLPHLSHKSVRGEMTPEQAVAIRLVGLAKERLILLDALMAEASPAHEPPRFFAKTPLSSLDCLAYGHLALMLKPPVPRSFLKDCIQSEAPRLAVFVDGLSINVEDLPWASPPPTTILRLALRFLDSAIRNAPTIGDYYANQLCRDPHSGAGGSRKRVLMHLSGLLAIAAAAGYALYTYRSLQPFGASTQVWRNQRGGSAMSRLSAMFGASLGLADVTPMPSIGGTGHGRLVDTDSDLD
ncbi:hypothetical protein CDD81_6095 [Ophiocordyceps australis]|uniref:Mitochondrial outer membrane transport complex Sam37/metaxin N-terminal domain-containing protein n=1 Tax=Ophiocordyceps australis TaxID=1399860 RepID=A0A2C5Y8W1_9HYPO|nr:hypothetical protein CDD81_6095 [Ophiocordyceps australis]